MSTIQPERTIGGLARGVSVPDVGDGTLVDDPAVRPVPVLNNRSFGEITEIVCGYAERPYPDKRMLIALGVAALAAGIGGLMILYLIITGVGVWGLTNQVDWAWDITNFVF